MPVKSNDMAGDKKDSSFSNYFELILFFLYDMCNIIIKDSLILGGIINK